LESAPTQQVLQSKSRGGTMGILNAGLLKDLDIIRPPLDVQDRFEEQVVRVRLIRNIASVAFSRSTSIFSSLQRRAFSGQL
jgi:type I restriction enzyme, S subunit